ncbi:MAG: site-2 protease family protein, partial [Rectinema sp.]
MISIILGLIGLSIVVIFHEFGHFVFARLSGVEVEAFSVGWGPSIISHKGKKTVWKLCAFPIGGYCKLKGEEGFQAAVDQNLQYIPSEKGSFFSATPLKR